MLTRRSEHGFSLVEALIAMAITATAFTAAAQLLVQASAATRRARLVTRAAIAAASKMEELESLLYGVGDDGADVQDEGLSPSPERSLVEDLAEYCEWFDSAGRTIGSGQRPPGALFARRWSVRALDDSGDTVALQVLVTSGAGPPLATLTTIRSRRGG
jgi:prepilin-type N-terminal cleavage/methylation domain-containing protein